ncbi:MAG: DUF1841 family protein [Gammaproteobacteria bacterium]|nr:DUF1841 family protein [Gammaproteobacteria bacterium]
MLLGQDRRETREVFFRAWQRHRENLPLEGIEPLVVTVVLRHPEYHALLEHPTRTEAATSARQMAGRMSAASRAPFSHRSPRFGPITEDRDYLPEGGQTNPFLHMGMHIAIEEQLALDQPRGIRAHYQQLLARLADEHAVQHRMMECLGEWLWRAGRNGAAPPETDYLNCLAQLASGAPPG